MNIGINILYLNPGKVGGTETYARGLIEGYLSVGTHDTFVIFCTAEAAQILPHNERLEVVKVRLKNRAQRLLYEQVVLPFMLVKHRVNVLHSFGYTSPLITHCPRITTIHDLNWYYHPEDFHFFEKLMWELLVKASAIFSDMITTVSKSSATSIIKVLRISPKKVSYSLSGMPAMLNISLTETNVIARKMKLAKKYIFTVLADYPHKNLITALRAYDLVSKKHPDVHFYICGLKGRATKKNAEYIKQHKELLNKIKIMGYVNEKELIALYRKATLFIFPSTYEGFGFPVVEAISQGIPVISSDSFSLKELILDKRALVNPYDHANMAENISKIIENEEYRKSITKNEEKILQIISWSSTAKDLLKIMQILLTKKEK